MIQNTPFIVVDLETTGLEPNLDNIIEIAAVKVLNGQIIDEQTHLVNPHIFIPQETTDITGITTDMLKESALFADIVDDYLGWFAEGGVFVAHNVDFDRNFFNSHLRRMQRIELSNPYLCTFKLAKTVHPNLPRYGLGVLAETFGIQMPQAHRAIHDARATAELLIKFMSTLHAGGLRQLKDLPCIQNLPKVTAMQEGQASLF
ncbi:3'-5' exonuclease [Candidatus Peregrinibacteria bacterium]|nr:MAG: 3'-5' exonuclease [Candidatus Peregrinibacteria bacterium]